MATLHLRSVYSMLMPCFVYVVHTLTNIFSRCFCQFHWQTQRGKTMYLKGEVLRFMRMVAKRTPPQQSGNLKVCFYGHTNA